MAGVDAELERFVAENFDSDEAVMLVLTLRRAASFSLMELYDRLAADFGLFSGEDRRVAEKRLELRLRDLTARQLISATDGGRYRYSGDDAITLLVNRLDEIFRQKPSELNRIIYSRTARARRLAEAFRL